MPQGDATDAGEMRPMKGRVLICAGSDSGGGAGIQADIKAVTALGGFAMTAITALTAQNTEGVHGVYDVHEEFIAKQIELVLKDLGADCIKTGMLHSIPVIETVHKALVELAPDTPLVVDPVMVAKGGHPLLESQALNAMKRRMVARATILTPNIPEAALLTGTEINTRDDMLKAGEILLKLGPKHVLMKGGHAQGAVCTDLLIAGDLPSLKLKARRLETKNTHGTGCTLSAAIAAALAKGADLPQAVRDAHAYLHGAISCADELRVGSGHGPVHHFYRQWGRA